MQVLSIPPDDRESKHMHLLTSPLAQRCSQASFRQHFTGSNASGGGELQLLLAIYIIKALW